MGLGERCFFGVAMYTTRARQGMCHSGACADQDFVRARVFANGSHLLDVGSTEQRFAGRMRWFRVALRLLKSRFTFRNGTDLVHFGIYAFELRIRIVGIRMV
jgi:hypothetical protein